MPVQYRGIIEEHLAVRSGCGIFDVSHMGEIVLSGSDALGMVALLTTNDPLRLRDGQCQYTLLCRPDGGIVDDCIVYRLRGDRFMFCVNAVNTQKVYSWMMDKREGSLVVEDLSEGYVQFALQGPLSVKVMSDVCGSDIQGLRRFHFVEASLEGVDVIVSRTGFSGEDGFEVYVPVAHGEGIWHGLMEAGSRYGIVPCGLGARDTLRLEMGYPLYGQDISEDTTPIEAGLERFVDFKKDSFIGRSALEEQKKRGCDRRLVGFVVSGGAIPRRGCEISSEGKRIGSVTSGGFSPSLRCGIGMGYVESSFAGVDREFDIRIRNRYQKARVVEFPFYTRERVKEGGRCREVVRS